MNSTHLKQPLAGLYLLTDPDLTADSGLIPAVAAALQGGVRLVQYRNKEADRMQQLWEVRDLITLCHPLGVPVIVNDSIEVAMESGADGVHLGSEDDSIEQARNRLGGQAIIGASCYNSLDHARNAAAQGASYIAFGRFFPSRSKPDAVHASPALLTEAKAELNLPVCAIGGIDDSNGGTLIDAGADLLAVIHAVLGSKNIQQSATEIAVLFDQGASAP